MTAKGSVHTDARSGPERDDRGGSSWGPVQILLDKGAGSANKVEHADVPMTSSDPDVMAVVGNFKENQFRVPISSSASLNPTMLHPFRETFLNSIAI